MWPDFNNAFNSPFSFFDPTTTAASFDIPQATAGTLAGWGVSPDQFIQAQQTGSVLAGANPGGGGDGSGTPSLGQSLTPTTGGGTADNLLKTLQSVKAPAAPTPQKVSTPDAPKPLALGNTQSQTLAALAALGLIGKPTNPLDKLPQSLGPAIGVR